MITGSQKHYCFVSEWYSLMHLCVMCMMWCRHWSVSIRSFIWRSACSALCPPATSLLSAHILLLPFNKQGAFMYVCDKSAGEHKGLNWPPRPSPRSVLSLLHHVAWMMIVRSASIFSLEHEIEPLKPIHYTLHTDVINTNPTPLWPLNIAHKSFPLSLSVWLAFRNPQSCTAERGIVCHLLTHTHRW